MNHTAAAAAAAAAASKLRLQQPKMCGARTARCFAHLHLLICAMLALKTTVGRCSTVPRDC